MSRAGQISINLRRCVLINATKTTGIEVARSVLPALCVGLSVADSVLCGPVVMIVLSVSNGSGSCRFTG